MAAIIVGILVGLGGLLVGGLVMAVMAGLGPFLALYRTAVGMVSKVKTVTMESASAVTRPVGHAETEGLPEGRRLEERRPAVKGARRSWRTQAGCREEG
jgi:hypothetical protein